MLLAFAPADFACAFWLEVDRCPLAALWRFALARPVVVTNVVALRFLAETTSLGVCAFAWSLTLAEPI